MQCIGSVRLGIWLGAHVVEGGASHAVIVGLVWRPELLQWPRMNNEAAGKAGT